MTHFSTSRSSHAPPDTYFFDNNLSPALVESLEALGEQAVHLRNEFPVTTADTVWIPAVASRGWILVTRDKKIRTKRAEIEALHRSGLSAFFFTQRHDPDLWGWAELVVLRWREIQGFASAHKRPFIAGIPGRRGSIQRLR